MDKPIKVSGLVSEVHKALGIMGAEYLAAASAQKTSVLTRPPTPHLDVAYASSVHASVVVRDAITMAAASAQKTSVRREDRPLAIERGYISSIHAVVLARLPRPLVSSLWRVVAFRQIEHGPPVLSAQMKEELIYKKDTLPTSLIFSDLSSVELLQRVVFRSDEPTFWPKSFNKVNRYAEKVLIDRPIQTLSAERVAYSFEMVALERCAEPEISASSTVKSSEMALQGVNYFFGPSRTRVNKINELSLVSLLIPYDPVSESRYFSNVEQVLIDFGDYNYSLSTETALAASSSVLASADYPSDYWSLTRSVSLLRQALHKSNLPIEVGEVHSSKLLMEALVGVAPYHPISYLSVATGVSKALIEVSELSPISRIGVVSTGLKALMGHPPPEAAPISHTSHNSTHSLVVIESDYGPQISSMRAKSEAQIVLSESSHPITVGVEYLRSLAPKALIGLPMDWAVGDILSAGALSSSLLGADYPKPGSLSGGWVNGVVDRSLLSANEPTPSDVRSITESRYSDVQWLVGVYYPKPADMVPPKRSALVKGAVDFSLVERPSLNPVSDELIIGLYEHSVISRPEGSPSFVYDAGVFSTNISEQYMAEELYPFAGVPYSTADLTMVAQAFLSEDVGFPDKGYSESSLIAYGVEESLALRAEYPNKDEPASKIATTYISEIFATDAAYLDKNIPQSCLAADLIFSVGVTPSTYPDKNTAQSSLLGSFLLSNFALPAQYQDKDLPASLLQTSSLAESFIAKSFYPDKNTAQSNAVVSLLAGEFLSRAEYPDKSLPQSSAVAEGVFNIVYGLQPYLLVILGVLLILQHHAPLSYKGLTLVNTLKELRN